MLLLTPVLHQMLCLHSSLFPRHLNWDVLHKLHGDSLAGKLRKIMAGLEPLWLFSL